MWVRRNRPFASSLAAVVLALAAGLAVSWELKRKADRSRVHAEGQTELAKGLRDKAQSAQALAEDRRSEIEARTYAGNLQMASTWRFHGDLSRARERLNECPPQDRENWEWLDARIDSSLLVLSGRDGGAGTAVFSNDGSRIVVAGGGATIWDVESGSIQASFRGTGYCAAFNPDDTSVTVAGMHGARMIDSRTGQEIQRLVTIRSPWQDVGLGSDGKWFGLLDGGRFRAWDTQTGNLCLDTGHASWTQRKGTGTFDFSLDGRLLVEAIEGNAGRVFDVETGKETVRFRQNVCSGNLAVFGPNSAHVLTQSEDGSLRVWDVSSGQRVSDLECTTGEFRPAAFSPDGTRIVTTCSDWTAHLWETSSGRSLLELEWPESEERITLQPSSGAGVRLRIAEVAPVTTAAFSPDGTRIVTAFSHDALRLWNADSGRLMTEFHGHTDRICSIAFDPGGNRILTGSKDGTARLWDAHATQSAKIPLQWAGQDQTSPRIRRAMFSADCSSIATVLADGSMRVWDALNGQCLSRLAKVGYEIRSATFSPDGGILAAICDSEAASGAHWVLVWDLVAGQCIAELGGQMEPVRCAFEMSKHGVIWDAIPYRERFPAILRARESRTLMQPQIEKRLASGEAPIRVRKSLAADTALSREQLYAGLAAVQAFEDQKE